MCRCCSQLSCHHQLVNFLNFLSNLLLFCLLFLWDLFYATVFLYLVFIFLASLSKLLFGVIFIFFILLSWTTNFGSGRSSNNTSLVSVLLIISLEISFASCLSDSSNKLSSSINISSIFGLASKIGLLSKISWINSSKWYCFFCSVAAVSVSLNFVASSKIHCLPFLFPFLLFLDLELSVQHIHFLFLWDQVV